MAILNNRRAHVFKVGTISLLGLKDHFQTKHPIRFISRRILLGVFVNASEGACYITVQGTHTEIIF